MATTPTNNDGGQQDQEFRTPIAISLTPRSSKSHSPRGSDSPEKPAPKVRRNEAAESVHGIVSDHHESGVEVTWQEEGPSSTVAIRTRAAEGSQAFGGGAEGNEFGNCKPSVSSEEAAGGFNPAAAGAEEAGLPLCDCCGSHVVAAELNTYLVMKCVPGDPRAS